MRGYLDLYPRNTSKKLKSQDQVCFARNYTERPFSFKVGT